ncbi:MAG TPA: DUF1415 family protein [Polyangiaceae bacterium]
MDGDGRDSGGEPVRPALAREAVRVYRRYQEEIVESLNLCPWAERARQDGRVREEVVFATSLDDASLALALDATAVFAEDESVEIGLILFPRLVTPPTAFERFVSLLSAADADRRPIGSAPFAMAAFHPHAAPDLRDPERLIPFLRRSPDPTVQLIRCQSLDRVREGFHEGTAFVDVSAIAALTMSTEDTIPLRTRIARANERTVRKVGVAEIERRLSSIAADRDAAYARLGEPPREP